MPQQNKQRWSRLSARKRLVFNRNKHVTVKYTYHDRDSKFKTLELTPADGCLVGAEYIVY